jgi:hypothetical protein
LTSFGVICLNVAGAVTAAELLAEALRAAASGQITSPAGSAIGQQF